MKFNYRIGKKAYESITEKSLEEGQTIIRDLAIQYHKENWEVWYDMNMYKSLRMENQLTKFIVKWFKKRSILLSNKKWILRLAKMVFDVKRVRGRGARKHDGKVYNRDLPLKYAKVVRVYFF